MVTNGVMEFIRRSDRDRYKYKSVYYRRLREQCLQDLKNLAEVAELLDERRKRRIFTFETLRPLVEAVLREESARTYEIALLFFNRGLSKLMDLVPAEFSPLVSKGQLVWLFSLLVDKKKREEGGD